MEGRVRELLDFRSHMREMIYDLFTERGFHEDGKYSHEAPK
jgi:hypothetical protein